MERRIWGWWVVGIGWDRVFWGKGDGSGFGGRWVGLVWVLGEGESGVRANATKQLRLHRGGTPCYLTSENNEDGNKEGEKKGERKCN